MNVVCLALGLPFAEIILILSADEFKNDRQMFAFLAAEQRITYKQLIKRCETKIRVYSGRNQNHRHLHFE